jgi:hypothetical protein
MATKPDYDFTELPKWAQEHIQSLERERNEAIRTLQEFQNDQKPSSFWVETWACTGDKFGPTTFKNYLQTRQVRIQVGKDEIDVYLREPDMLEISAFGGRLTIEPNASNVIYVRGRK